VTVTDSTVSDNDGGYGGGIHNSGTLTVMSSTLSDNFTGVASPGPGGGIYNTGTLTVAASILTGNSCYAGGINGAGGAISNADGTVAITGSTFSDNAANYVSSGGAISNAGGTVTITDSSFSGNRAAYYGGGIYNSGMLTVTSSTLSGNSVGGGFASAGGGIYNVGAMVVTNCTLSGNTALVSRGGGGGIVNDVGGTLAVTSSTISGNHGQSVGGIANAGTTTIRNTIVAVNDNGFFGPFHPDVDGVFNSQGHNLIGIGDGGGYADSDLVGTSGNPIEPKLGPLQDNGGPTFTMALLPGSPAIDAGDNADAPPFDQRGPGFARIVNGRIDIGAFEVQVAVTVQCSVTTPVLWPPNNQLVNVGLSVQVSDPNATVTVQVYANDDALPSDAADLAPGRLRLRSQRQGSGSGRVYLIVVTATDAAGNVAVSECTVVAPHDHSAHSQAAVEQQAADAEAYFQAFHTAPPGYRLLG